MLTYTATHQKLITDSGQKTRGGANRQLGSSRELEERERPLRKEEKRLKNVFFFLVAVGVDGGGRAGRSLARKFRCEARLCCNLSKTAGTSLKWRQLRATAEPAGRINANPAPAARRQAPRCFICALCAAAKRMRRNGGAVIYQASRGID